MNTNEDRTLFPELEGDSGHAPVKRFTRGLVVALFLGVCVTVGVVDAVAPIVPPKLAGSEKHDAAEERMNAKISDGTRMKLLEKDMKRRSRVRHVTASPYAFALFKAFDILGPTAVVGPHGWVFLKQTIGNSPRPAEEIAETSVCLVTAAARRFENLGMRWISMPIPRKSVVVSSELPRGIDPRPDIDAAVVAALVAHGVECVDLREAIAGLPIREAFQPWDPHWADGACLVAGELMVAQVGAPLGGERSAKIVRVPDAATHAYALRTAGIFSTKKAPSWIKAPTQLGVRIEGNRRIKGRPYSPPGTMSRAALIGSSYSMGGRLKSIVEYYLGEGIWSTSEPGLGIVENCGRFLAATRNLDKPELVWHEFPIHHVLLLDQGGKIKHLNTALAAIFVEEPAGPQRTLRDSSQLPLKAVNGKGNAATFVVEEGRIASTGDGVLNLRVQRLGSIDEALSMGVRTGSYNLPIRFKAGQSSAVVPILERRRSGERLFITTDNRDAEVELSFVTDLDLDHPRSTAVEIQRNDDGEVVASFDGSAKVPRFGGLRIEFEESAGDVQDVSIHVSTAENEAVYDVRVGPGAGVLLNVGVLWRQKLQSVRIVGTGPGPAPGAMTVSLHPQLHAK